MSPILFNIGNFELRWYSVLILTGVLFAYIVIASESKKFQIRQEFMVNLIFWGLMLGIFGARMYYVIFNWDYYSSNIKEIVMVWRGGLAIHGGLIMGAIVTSIYCKRHNARVLKIYDILVPGLILAQSIGRWGNFFNGEAYGTAVRYDVLANMKIIPKFVMDNMFINGSYHLPMFYFESLACFLGFIILIILRRRKYAKIGQTFGFYLAWYGFIRFFVEIFRTDSLMFLDFKAAQVVSVLMILFGLYIVFSQGKKPKLDDLYNKIDDNIIY